jgi:hypothetical protein
VITLEKWLGVIEDDLPSMDGVGLVPLPADESELYDLREDPRELVEQLKALGYIGSGDD